MRNTALPRVLQTHADCLPVSSFSELTYQELAGQWVHGRCCSRCWSGLQRTCSLGMRDRHAINCKVQSYVLCGRGCHCGTSRGWNDLDLGAAIRLLLEETWANYLISLNLSFLICKMGHYLTGLLWDEEIQIKSLACY